jgi:hypothetical protein
MKTSAEVLENHEDLALYWRDEIRRRHKMQMPIAHDPLEVRSLLYGEIIRNLYFALKNSVADLDEYKEGIEIERQWKQEAYERNIKLKEHRNSLILDNGELQEEIESLKNTNRRRLGIIKSYGRNMTEAGEWEEYQDE